jgi:exopolysaccharide biosynthesis protein
MTKRVLLVFNCLFVLIGCGVSSIVPSGPTPRPTRTPFSAPLLPPETFTSEQTLVPEITLSPPAVTLELGWESLAPGLDLRVASMWVSGVSGPVEITMLRIDPSVLDIRTHYGLDNTATVKGWHERTGALAVINGAFFEPRITVLGLLVEDGISYGLPFEDHGGMLSIKGDAAEVRSLVDAPIQPGEEFDYAIQGRPMLLMDAGQPANFDLSPEASRRTIIAQDWEGRVIFMVNDYGAISLYKMRDWLATTPELNIVRAFNLDGGGSTGMAFDVNGRTLLIDSWWPVATAVAVYPKE